MVLSLKTWKSRSLPALPRTLLLIHDPYPREVYLRARSKRPPEMAAVLFSELPSESRWAAAVSHPAAAFFGAALLPGRPGRGAAVWLLPHIPGAVLAMTGLPRFPLECAQ